MLAASVGVALLSAVAPVALAKGHKKHELAWTAQAGGRIAPLGLEVSGTAGYRRRLVNKDSLLFKDSHVALLGIASLTPTYFFTGATLRIEPLAILSLWANYQVGGFFGTLKSVQSFESSLSNLSKKKQYERITSPVKQPVFAQRLTFSGRLQAKYKRFAARYTASARRHFMSLPMSDTAWHNANLDLIAPARGWTLHQDADLLYELRSGVFLAARYSQTAAYHEDREHPIMIRRLGPAAVWRRPSSKGSRVRASTWFLLVQWSLTHPYRDGEILPVALPMMLLGWSIEGR